MRIAVIGGAGRMGLSNCEAILEAADTELAGAVEGAGHPAIGSDIGRLLGRDPLAIAVTADLEAVLADADVAIDFTTPAASAAHASIAARIGRPLVIGTTGLGATESATVAAASHKIAVVQAANMSRGVTLLQALVRQVAAALDEDFDVEIVEMHHNRKVDAPSGTALALGEAAAIGRGVDLETAARRARDGLTGPRQAGTIGFAVLRGGDVVGDHSVIFAGAGERIELSHRASDRQVFSRGAVAAARWVTRQAPGLYSMEDVLGLRSGG